MATLTAARIEVLLEPYYPAPSPYLLDRLSTFLDLLLRWNARTNLTAIRDPEEIVRRHFGESLLTAAHVPESALTLLDLGSGAGFPGIPIQLARPALQITLAESQNKKAAFLHEAVRVLEIGSVVWPARVESLPESQRFDVVAMRAVDNPVQALELAGSRLKTGGTLLHLAAPLARNVSCALEFPIPGGNTVLRVTLKE